MATSIWQLAGSNSTVLAELAWPSHRSAQRLGRVSLGKLK